MRNFLLFTGVLAGGIAAFYLLDPHKGRKRRKKLQKQVDHALQVAGKTVEQYSREWKPHLQEWSHQLADKAQEYSRDLGSRAKHQLNGNSHWTPSARLLGAAASGLAFYGAGRPGFTGILLRTISLGMFTRALLASR